MEDTFSLHGCGPSASRTLFNPRSKNEKESEDGDEEDVKNGGEGKKAKKDKSNKSDGDASGSDEQEGRSSSDAKAVLQAPPTDMESGQVRVID
jgi:hypothetical protein